MSHFRDRVILTQTDQNIPQLPSSRRARKNVPMLTQSATLAVLADLNLYAITPPAVDMTSVVPTQTKTATSP